MPTRNHEAAGFNSRRQRRLYHSALADKGVFMAKTSHELAIEFAVEITELCSKIKG